jgi:hypothetical protein
MNRFERRKTESLKRKVRALKPAARELAIQTGMELHDPLAEERAEKHKQEIQALVEKAWASKYDELYKRLYEEQANRFAERVAEVDRKAREHLSDLVRWRQAYLATYVAWFADGGSPESQGRITSKEAVEAAAHEFKDRLKIIDNRVEKEAAYFYRPELLYGVLRWLATTYHAAKTGGGKWVKLKEHVRFGTSRDPRHTIRVAFFFDDKIMRVIVGYVGLHQQTRAT